MKFFLRDTLFVSLIGIVVIMGLETTIRLIPSDNTFSFKYNYMETCSSEIKTLLLGHSLFEESFNSNVLGDSTFNLAIRGRVSFYDVQLLERYIDRMLNLKVVLFPIHYALDNPCEYYDSDGKEASVYHYYKYMKIQTPECMYLYYLPKVTFQWEKKNHSIDTIDSTGYARLTDGHYKISQPLKRQYTQVNCDIFFNNLRKIAQICYQHHVRFIAVTPPSTDVYLAYTTPDGVKRINDIINSIQEVYPIEYYNYLSDSAFRSDSLYFDATHLSHRGATLFAQRVKKDFDL